MDRKILDTFRRMGVLIDDLDLPDGVDKTLVMYRLALVNNWILEGAMAAHKTKCCEREDNDG